MPVYQLLAVFHDGDFEKAHQMLFTVDTYEEATIAAWRWVRNRQLALPEVFGRLNALKVYQFHIGKPEPDGYIGMGLDLAGYEWKFDWGIPPLIPELS